MQPRGSRRESRGVQRRREDTSQKAAGFVHGVADISASDFDKNISCQTKFQNGISRLEQVIITGLKSSSFCCAVGKNTPNKKSVRSLMQGHTDSRIGQCKSLNKLAPSNVRRKIYSFFIRDQGILEYQAT